MVENDRTMVSLEALDQFRVPRLSPSGIVRGVLRFAREKPLGFVGAVLVVTLVIVALTAAWIAPYDPYGQALTTRLKSPSTAHWLGTDHLGRDLLSRVIWGARISLWVGCISVGIGTSTGAFLGLISGYFGGKLDLVLQRVLDSLMAFPALVLAMAVVAMLGTGITNVMLAISVVIIPGVSRIVRGAVLSTKENQYIEAAHCVGARNWRILLFHVLPNVAAPIIVITTVQLGSAILAEAALSFLGLGTQQPTPSWGNMLAGDSQRFMLLAPWMAVFPGIAITLAVFGFNTLGDGLRDILDPRMRGAGRIGY